ncbi:ATP-dependent helicase brm-like [Macrobrachium nipponense]|uniref:ATP-dependent helicase brm-like n=1 Tax=Macrobrachium nipponense TaxID=159736 RepID=UPI0030C7E35F
MQPASSPTPTVSSSPIASINALILKWSEDEPEAWLEEVEALFENYPTTEIERAALLAKHLDGKTKTALRSLDQGQRGDLVEVHRVITKAYEITPERWRQRFRGQAKEGPLRGIAPPVPVTGPVDLNSQPVPSSLDVEPPPNLTSAPGPELPPAPNLFKDPPTGDPPTGMELTAAHGQSPAHNSSSASPLSPEDEPPADLTFSPPPDNQELPTRSQSGVLPLRRLSQQPE